MRNQQMINAFASAVGKAEVGHTQPKVSASTRRALKQAITEAVRKQARRKILIPQTGEAK